MSRNKNQAGEDSLMSLAYTFTGHNHASHLLITSSPAKRAAKNYNVFWTKLTSEEILFNRY